MNMAGGGEPVVRMAEGGIAHFAKAGPVVDYRQAIIDEAKRQGVPPEVALQISGVESNFDPKAKPIDPATGKPRSSATSFFQVIDETFKNLGGSAEKRTDPMENIRVGVKALAQNQAALTKQLGRAPNPSELYTTHFLGTPTGAKLLSANPEMPVKQFLKEADPKRADSIMNANPEVLKGKTVGEVLAWTQKKMAPILTSAIPIGSANAAPPPVATPAVPGNTASQIPGQRAQAAPTVTQPRSQFGAMLDAGKNIVGAGETALQYATGLAALPTAGGAAVLGQIPNIVSGKGADRAEMEKSFREKSGQVTYEPRTEGGQAVSEGFAKTLEDLKIPPYLAHMGNLSPKRGRAGIPAAELEALARAKEAEAAAAAAKTQNLRLEPPRTETPSSFTVDRDGRAIPTDTFNRGLNRMADVDAAAKAASEAEAYRNTVREGKATQGTESTRPEVLQRNAELARTQNIAVAASPAVTAGNGLADLANAGAPATKGINTSGDDLSKFYDLGPTEIRPPDKDLIKAAKEAVPAEDRQGFSKEDILMLSLNLLANKSPRFLNALGESGIATLQAKKEREKSAQDVEYKDIMKKYYGSLGLQAEAATKKAETETGILASGEKARTADRQKAMADITASMEAWGKSKSGMFTPEEEDAQRRKLTQLIFGGYGLPIPATMMSSGLPQGVKVTPYS
jgi:hypothetical protein